MSSQRPFFPAALHVAFLTENTAQNQIHRFCVNSQKYRVRAYECIKYLKSLRMSVLQAPLIACSSS